MSTTIYLKNNTSANQVILVSYGDADESYAVDANSETSFVISLTEGASLGFTLPTWPNDGELLAVWIGNEEWVTEVNDLPDNFSFKSTEGKMTFTCID